MERVTEEISRTITRWLDEPRKIRFEYFSDVPQAAACPSINLVYPSPSITGCDSISATKTKCGFGAFPGFSSNKIYLTKTTNGVVTITDQRSGVTFDHCDFVQNASYSYERVEQYTSSSCSYNLTCGESIGNYEDHVEEQEGGHCQPYPGCTAVINPGCLGTCLAPISTSCGPVYFHCGENCGSGNCPGFLSVVTNVAEDEQTQVNTCSGAPAQHGSFDRQLSDEYTTAALISNTEAALPSYSGQFAGLLFPSPNKSCSCVSTSSGGSCHPSPPYGSGQSCSCTAYRNLSPSESSYTIRRIKYKWTLGGATGLQIFWDDRLCPDTGSPSDTPRSGVIDTAYETLEPSDNGVVDICHVQRQYRFEFTDNGHSFDFSWDEHVVPGDGSPSFNIHRSAHYDTGTSGDHVLGPFTPTLGNFTTTITNMTCVVTDE